MKLRNIPQKQEHGGCIRRLHADGSNREIIDFSASMNPYPPRIDWSPESCDLSAYPDDTYAELKEAIGSVFNRDSAEIAVGNGSVELIRIYAQVMVPPGSIACIENPTFGEYAQSVLLAGGSITDVPSDDATVRYLCNPNNPTGVLHQKNDILDILNDCREVGSSLFLDEAFIDLADPRASVSDLRDPDLFVLRSLTKSFSVPGIRFGFGFGDPELILAIERTRPPWTVNRYAESFAISAISYLPDLAQSRKLIDRNREFLIGHIESLGFTPHPSSANYILIHTGRQASELTAELLAKGVLVRDCTSFGLPESIRVAVRTEDENQVLLEALSACAS